MTVPHSLEYYSIVVNFEVEKCLPILLFILKTILVIWVPCIFIQHSKFILSISAKMSAGILIGNVWNLCVTLSLRRALSPSAVSSDPRLTLCKVCSPIKGLGAGR